jgi:hypothetical protein
MTRNGAVAAAQAEFDTSSNNKNNARRLGYSSQQRLEHPRLYGGWAQKLSSLSVKAKPINVR